MQAQGASFFEGTAQGGTINVIGDGGTIDVAGTLRADATAQASFQYDAVGGNITLQAANLGKLTTGGIDLDATGTGAGTFFGQAGNGTGGTIVIRADNGGSVKNTGFTDVTSDGVGGFIEQGGTGGTGRGGRVFVRASGGSLDLASVAVEATGTGGSLTYASASSALGGYGYGGSAQLFSEEIGSSIHVSGVLSIDASGTGGDAVDGGSGFGGGVLPPQPGPNLGGGSRAVCRDDRR